MKNNKKRTLRINLIGVGFQLFLVVLAISIVLNTLLIFYNKSLQHTITVLRADKEMIEISNEKLAQEIENLKYPVGKAEDLNWVHEELDTQFEALVQATWRIETGNGTSNLWITHNNAGGIKGIQNDIYGYMSYESKEQGFQALRDLLHWYVEQFGYDLESIRNLYCQCDIQDLNTFTELFIEEGGVVYE